MRQNKKIVSLAVVFAMLVTMISSMVVVNAESKPEVYTSVTETETGYTVTVGYDKMPADTNVQAIEFGVKTPTGLKVTNATYVENLSGEPQINTDVPGYVYFAVASAKGISSAAKQDILTIDYVVETQPTVTTDYKFLIEGAYISANNDEVEFDQANDQLTLVEGTVSKYVETTDPAIYVETSEMKTATDEVTIKVGYKNFPADTNVQAIEFGVKLPDGFTVVADSAAYTENLSGEPQINTDVPGYVYFAVASAKGISSEAKQEILTFKVKYTGDVAEGQKFTFAVEGGYASANNDAVEFDQAEDTLAVIPGILTVGGSEPTTSPEPGDSKIKSVTLDATAKAAKAGNKVTFNVTVDGTGDKSVTATAKMGDTNVEVDVKGSVVTVTVPSGATEGAKIELVVTAVADTTKFAKATITVIDPVIDIKPAKKTETSMNGAKVNMFAPNIAAVAGKDIATKFAADQTYRVVFDCKKEDGTTVGISLTSITGAQVKLLAEGDTSIEVFGSAIGAEAATIHFEDSTGKVIQ